MNHYRHAAQVAESVHEGLIQWVRHLMIEAGLEQLEILGRFPAEGSIRSHLVLFPYRVGPWPMIRDNAPGTSLMLQHGNADVLLRSVPGPWRIIAELFMEGFQSVFSQLLNYKPGHRISRSPFPPIESVGPKLQAWYNARSGDDKNHSWVIPSPSGLRIRPPGLAWRAGTRVSVHYLAFASDPGRGTSSQSSDSPPISLPALTVLTTAIQLDSMVRASIPARPLPEGFSDYVEAFAETWEIAGASTEQLSQLNDALDALKMPMEFEFSVTPLNDLNDQEFALLTQALQRPLQAVLNMRIAYPVGLHAEFYPATTVGPMDLARS